ncbi:hypothetical protein [Ensifer sp. B1-9]|uniref:hypothetical protein n=1 Tax=Ensifer sp. B1-9 TaxID=3141455 RepID=UPI003D215DA4
MSIASPPSAPGSIIPATVWLLGFVSMLMDISSEMVQTPLPLYLASGLGASAAMVGLIEGLSVAVATVTKFAARVSGCASPSTRSGLRRPIGRDRDALADIAPADLRGSAFGLFNLMTGAAVVVANLAAGLLWDRYGAAATFVMGAVFSSIALIALPLLPRSDR